MSTSFFSKISWRQLLSPTDTMPQRPVEGGQECDLRFEGLKDLKHVVFRYLFAEFLGKHEGNLRKCCWCCVGFGAFAGHSIPFHSFSKAHCVAFVQMIDLQAVLLASSINLWNTEIWGYVNTITFNYHVWGGPITIHKSKLFWNILTTMLLLPLTQVGWSIVTSVVLDGC